MEPVVIFRTHTQDVIAFIVSVVFIACGAWALMLPTGQITADGRLIVWLLMSLFISIAAFAASGLVSRKPALTIDRTGITDNASGLSVGFIPWSDIVGIRIVTLQAQKYLGVSLRNPNEYLKRAPLVKRLLIRTNVHCLGHVVNIPQLSLPVPVEDLLAKMGQFSGTDGDQPGEAEPIIPPDAAR